jgi:putative transposase
MSSLDLAIVGEDIRGLVRPKTDEVLPARRTAYNARCAAMIDVAGGSAVAVAAATHGVDPRTVARDCHIAMETAADGQRIGFRACIPYQLRRPKAPPHEVYVQPAISKGPHALIRTLAACPKLQKLIDDYRGALPNGTCKVRAFDRLFDQFKAIIRTQLGAEGYPFNVLDEGRRALLNHLARLRRARLEAGAAEVEGTEPNLTRFNQLFHLAPLDRIEFDAHKIDTDWVLTLKASNGKLAKRHIRCVTLLAAVCASSRYMLAYVLVLGAYNRLDVLRLFHRVLSSWHPRELIVPDMRYPEGAQLGLPVDEHGVGPRGVAIAGDNALAHHAEICVDNLLGCHRGILNFGPAHVPEVRPIIESLFRLLEQGALRQMAGAFQPETRANGKTRTSFLRSEDHPFHYEAMEDLLDVIAAGYNITPHTGLGGCTPASVLNTHLASGWSWYSSDAATDASSLTTVRFPARVRGNKTSGRLPFVQYYSTHYRSQKLMGRRDLVGKRFIGEANLQDLRQIVLLSPEDGSPWSRLTALPPWDRTPHDLHLRQQIIRARNRGLLELTGSRDAIACYHVFTRKQALQGKAPPDLYARVDAHFKPAPERPSNPGHRPAVLPRRGPITFAHTKD